MVSSPFDSSADGVRLAPIRSGRRGRAIGTKTSTPFDLSGVRERAIAARNGPKVSAAPPVFLKEIAVSGPSRILCAVDFSRPAQAAFEHALALSRDRNAELTAVHAIPVSERFNWRARERTG